MRRVFAGTVAAAALLAACSTDDDTGSAVAAGQAPTTAHQDGDTPETTQPSSTSATTTPLPADNVRSDRVIASTGRWPTDWTKATIDLQELAVGIGASDPRDVIRPIYAPLYTTVAQGAEWLLPRDPGALVEVNGDVRFFPLAIMTRHEIVNGEIGGLPVAVTYCPLCNTALAFERVANGEEIMLGVSGLLRNSDLVMWDHDTVSLWQQITGEAIVGALAGTQLPRLSTAIVGFGEVQENFPDAQVLSRDTGFGTSYGANPYQSYSSQAAPYPGFAEPPADDTFAALERVVGVTIGDTDKAYAFSVLEREPAINDVVNGEAVAVLWGGVTVDALDNGVISNSRATGTGIAFHSTVDGQVLTFSSTGDDEFTDAETGSTWTLLGRATAGPLEGAQLEIAAHRNEFWFAFRAFFPDAEVYL
ncbi:MAG: DUF3179 domain-containing protein [Actinomycetota bacterium]|nr:DUF3179 domain-containing protein [Actinomycetota bacterium]